jgi:hypothetical protein
VSLAWLGPDGSKATVIQRLRRGQTYVMKFL